METGFQSAQRIFVIYSTPLYSSVSVLDLKIHSRLVFGHHVFQPKIILIILCKRFNKIGGLRPFFPKNISVFFFSLCPLCKSAVQVTVVIVVTIVFPVNYTCHRR